MSFLLIAQIGAVFTWAGLILGLSFIETPLKFHAPGITTSLGVGIGRLVFAALNRADLAFSALLLATLVIGRRDVIKYGIFSLILAMVLTQTFWLLPVLDARAQLLLDGHPPAASFHHLLFIGIESVKLMALISLGVFAGRRGEV